MKSPHDSLYRQPDDEAWLLGIEPSTIVVSGPEGEIVAASVETGLPYAETVRQ